MSEIISDAELARLDDGIMAVALRGAKWCEATFGKEVLYNRKERALRLFEEALELAQAEGVDPAAIAATSARVLSRPPGDPYEEAADVGFTLLVWHFVAGGLTAPFLRAVSDEITRCEKKPAAHYRARHAAKAAVGAVVEADTSPAATRDAAAALAMPDGQQSVCPACAVQPKERPRGIVMIDGLDRCSICGRRYSEAMRFIAALRADLDAERTAQQEKDRARRQEEKDAQEAAIRADPFYGPGDTVVAGDLTVVFPPADAPVVVSANQIRKNAGRPRIAELVPLGLLEAVARASEVGLVKYARDSFREKGGYSIANCLNSAARHIYARMGGERYDMDGSKYVGKPVDHLDQAAWNIAAACEAIRLYGMDKADDTWKGPNGDHGIPALMAMLASLEKESK